MSEKKTIVFVAGLNPLTREKDLTKEASKSGKVNNCELIIDPNTEESREFAFVTMNTPEEAQELIQRLNGSMFDGKVVRAEMAKRATAHEGSKGKPRGSRAPTRRPYDGPPFTGGYPISYDPYARYYDPRFPPMLPRGPYDIPPMIDHYPPPSYRPSSHYPPVPMLPSLHRREREESTRHGRQERDRDRGRDRDRDRDRDREGKSQSRREPRTEIHSREARVSREDQERMAYEQVDHDLFESEYQNNEKYYYEDERQVGVYSPEERGRSNKNSLSYDERSYDRYEDRDRSRDGGRGKHM
jgi:transformer-2 protein